MPRPRLPSPDYQLDLDRRRPETLHRQARRAIEAAIRAARPGFRVGERLSTLALSRRNPIHRNTLARVMDELVYRGYLRRVPNKGFEIRERRPERPTRLTRHHLSLFTLAHRHRLATRSRAIPAACGLLPARELGRAHAAVVGGLRPAAGDSILILCRLREVRSRPRAAWTVVAVERTAVPAALLPSFLSDAQKEIRRRGDFSVLHYLEKSFPNDDFFKADYEISLASLPPELAPFWKSPTPPMSVVNVTYGTAGAIECTQTWFDPSRAVLLAGSLDARVL